MGGLCVKRNLVGGEGGVEGRGGENESEGWGSRDGWWRGQ